MKFIKLLFLVLVFISCNDKDTDVYTGKLIELDFNNVEEISPDSWIKFDEYKFEHIKMLNAGNKVEFPLPIHYVVIDTTNKKRDFTAPLDVKNIGLHIGRNLRKVNNLKEEGKSKFMIYQPQTLAAIGILKIKKTDSSNFKITTSKNYPIKITVLED